MTGQMQPPVRQIRRADSYQPPGPDDADQGTIPADPGVDGEQ